LIAGILPPSAPQTLSRIRITEPTLLLDAAKCRANIEIMSTKAREHRVKFRPHFKTHQSLEIGRWFRPFGVDAITVSSLKMASYFAADGWNDITVAFPVNILEIDRIRTLAEKIRLNLLVEARKPVEQLGRQLERPVGLYIKIDTGYGRTGIPSGRRDAIDGVISEISKYSHLEFKGFLTHAGHTYRATSRSEIVAIHEDTLKKMAEMKKHYVASFPRLKLSIGDTPSCSVGENFAGIDEIRPGNFVFYDAMQYLLGSCPEENIAVTMACPVVATHIDRGQIIIYGGAVHFSKDSVRDANGRQIFGLVVELQDDGWSPPVPDAVVSSLSQEHGVITARPEFIDHLSVGSVLGVLPVHSCLTADCMKGYRTLDDRQIDHLSRTM